MVEYRFKMKRNAVHIINRHTPLGKEFRVDKYTGEYWIKVTNSEHTPKFRQTVEIFCELLECDDTLTIKDCSNMEHTSSYDDNRPSLF